MKKFTASILTILMLVNVFAMTFFSVFAEDKTDENTIEVSSAAELAAIAVAVKNGNHFEGKTVSLTQNIDLGEIANWNPIGFSLSSCFSGVFNGNYHTISNLNYDYAIDAGNIISMPYHTAGLFGVCVNAAIRNVTLKNVNINLINTSGYYNAYSSIDSTNIYTGGLTGYASGTIIEGIILQNATIKGSTQSEAGTCFTGGIVGYATGGTSIEYSFVEGGTVNGTCSSINGNGVVGGIIGQMQGSVSVSKSYNTASVAGGHSTGSSNSGGLVGKMEGGAHISDCYNIGNVTHTGSWLETGTVGGIAGYAYGSIRNCYNKGFLVANTNTVGGDVYVGGIAGNASSSTQINNCASVSSKISGGTKRYTISGAGVKTNNISVSGITGSPTNDSNAQFSVSDFLSDTLFSNRLSWDFSNIWYSESGQLPKLRGALNPTVDADGDGLSDVWEIRGFDEDGDGAVDIDLPAMGADPSIPDIFVEIDWMVRPQKKFLWWEQKKHRNLAPSETAMRMVYDVFNSHGIQLHIDVGPDSTDFVTGQTWGVFSGGNEIPYEAMFDIQSSWQNIADSNFTSARNSIFKYCLFLDQFDGTTSGIANDIPGQYFIVANQDWVYNGGNISVAGSFMHELGHTLGLCHGGCDHEHYKPNYLSVMNYAFQTTGLVGTGEINYSDYKLPDIDEYIVNEHDGIDPHGLTAGTNLGTTLFYRTADARSISPIAGIEIDFNNNSEIEESILLDLNPGGNVQDGPFAVLKGHEDWSGITYSGGDIGNITMEKTGVGFYISDDFTSEKTLEESLATSTLAHPGTGYIELLPSTLIQNIPDQFIDIEVGNLSAVSSVFTVKIECPELFDSFITSVEISGSEEKIETTKLSVPISKTVNVGTYAVDCTLTSSNSESFYSFCLEAVALTAQDISEMKEALENEHESLNDSVEHIEAIIAAVESISDCDGDHHNYELIQSVEATCSSNGYRMFVCTNCGDTKTESIEKTVHSPEVMPAVAATCKATGLTEGSKCSVCGEILVAQEVTPKIAHTWNDGVVTKEASCEEEGVKTFTCTACGDTRTDSIIATGHNYGSWAIVKTPTCTEEGSEQRVCKNDGGHIETRILQKTAHADADGDNLCDVCGTEVKTIKESNCVCGEYHTGPFAWLIRFLHKIVFFFKNLFGKN